MTLEEAKNELEKFVKLKTTLRPAFLDVILKAEPVRHGKWIHNGFMEVKCNNCGNVFHELEDINYCPNCGAKMDLNEVEE